MPDPKPPGSGAVDLTALVRLADRVDEHENRRLLIEPDAVRALAGALRIAVEALGAVWAMDLAPVYGPERTAAVALAAVRGLVSLDPQEEIDG